jgi:hypothetical protein
MLKFSYEGLCICSKTAPYLYLRNGDLHKKMSLYLFCLEWPFYLYGEDSRALSHHLAILGFYIAI